jgi:hypothetical protein
LTVCRNQFVNGTLNFHWLNGPGQNGNFEMAKSKPPVNPAPLTSPAIRHIAGVGLKAPSTLSTKQVQKLAASVEAHIEPRHKKR